jgi:rhamnosyltransferase
MANLTAVAGIVTFNPDIDRLRENLEHALNQVDHVIVVDNASNNFELVTSLVNEFTGVSVIRNGVNGGIAIALNQVMGWALKHGATWALLLDQDSVIAPGMVGSLLARAEPTIGIVCPTIIDRSSTSREPVSSRAEVNYCITSGSLCNVQIWESLGGYDEAIFIDFVDFDYCLRLREAGFRIVREPQATLLHEIGKISRHGRLTAYHHSAFRSYHMARDMLYYAHKHRHALRELKVQRRGVLGTYAVLLRKMIIISLFEEDRLHRVASVVRGTISGTLALLPRAHTVL